MKLKASDWNEAMRDLCTRYPLSVQFEEAQPPDHAWSVYPLWDEVRKKWTARIRPGSVNCRIPTIALPFSRASENFKKYIQQANPDKQYTPTMIVNVPLDFDPAIDLNWREIGGSAAPLSTTGNLDDGIINSYEPVPSYFKKKGVVAPGSTNFDPALQCKLFACDIVLSMPRPYLVNEISAFPGGALGGSIISVDAKPSTPPDISDPPRIYAIARYSVPVVQNSFADIFFQRFLDEPKDDLHLSTIYALSKPGAGMIVPLVIDSTYNLETRYYCHYNLAHATAQVVPRVATPPLRLVTGLAAGLGDVMFNLILSTANDFAQSVLDLFNQRSVRGMFWVV
jgi:hypothetical protein